MNLLEQVEAPIGILFVRAREPLERGPELGGSFRVQRVLPRNAVGHRIHLVKVVV